jgi:hypothetical protein
MHGDQFVVVRTDQHHGLSSSRQFVDQSIHRNLGADIDALCGFIQQKDVSSGDSQRAMTIFCWLPPDSSPTRRSSAAGVTASRAIKSRSGPDKLGDVSARSRRAMGAIRPGRLCRPGLASQCFRCDAARPRSSAHAQRPSADLAMVLRHQSLQRCEKNAVPSAAGMRLPLEAIASDTMATT